MGSFDEIMERAESDSLVSYLLDGACMSTIKEDLYYKQVDAVCEHLFDELDKEFQTKSRENGEICSMLADICSVCQEVYFKAGLAAGFQVCKNLNTEYLSMEENESIKFMIRRMAEKMK